LAGDRKKRKREKGKEKEKGKGMGGVTKLVVSGIFR
jgi:hypothetical protein